MAAPIFAVDELLSFLLATKFLYPEKLAGIELEAVRTTLERLRARADLYVTYAIRDGLLRGHVCGARVYERTWMLQHLASAAPGKRGLSSGLRLSLGLLDALEQQPSAEYFKIWYRPQNRWPARVYGRFAGELADETRSDHRLFCYMTARARAHFPRASRIEIVPASGAELGYVAAYFASRGESLLQRADDLSAHELSLPSMGSAYARSGLERRREVLVALRRGEPTGLALLEISSPGINFSELTNTFRVFAEHDDEAVLSALIAAARQRYTELGYARVIALSSDQRALFERLGFAWTKDYACWTWHRALLPQFCDYLRELPKKGRK